jgi:hypothetical protein
MELRDASARRFQHTPVALRGGEHPTFLEVAARPQAQQAVVQHRAQRGRHAERETPIHAIRLPAEHPGKQRQIGLSHRLMQPRFLEEAFVLGMPHIGKVRVQHEGQLPADRRIHRIRNRSIETEMGLTPRRESANERLEYEPRR